MDATTLQRLLKYPHAAVFDKAPAQELAFLLRHPDVASWRVAERLLTVTVGEVDSVYSLADFNVGELVDQLRDDGFEVTHLTNEYRYLSALALVEGEGGQLISNGDQLHVFTSLLWVLLSAYAAELKQAGDQIIQALRQMVITTSEGEWLDLWGALYAEARRPSESDASYAARIPQEAFRLRVNARAIELAIFEATGYDVRIEEPWEKVFRLDESTLSGPHKLYDGALIGPHLIQPVTRQAINWPAVLAVINRNRAAGVLVLGPHTTLASHLDTGLAPVVHGGGLLQLGARTIYEDRALLDFSPIEEASIPNRAALYRREINHPSAEVVVDQTYVAHAAHWSRDYRVFYLDVQYQTQYWDQTGARTWASLPIESWESINATIYTGHTRES